MTAWIVLGILVLALGVIESLTFASWRDLRKRKYGKAGVLYAIHLTPIVIAVVCAIFNSWATAALEKIYSWHFIELLSVGFALLYILPMVIMNSVLLPERISYSITEKNMEEKDAQERETGGGEIFS